MKIKNSRIFFCLLRTIFVIFYATSLLADTNCLVVGGVLNDEAEMGKARYRQCTQILNINHFLFD